eukprot:TRINITY_DN35178_c1_g1_i1.p1 TRINITY_DN35178_c1_g1~~TRINITY_DN35178_c1_g1_i1.p1  ORF type:complete len:105 (+),score=9.39 TRINITY_DN35178_c1_g1_i1:1140-1454(+)
MITLLRESIFWSLIVLGVLWSLRLERNQGTAQNQVASALEVDLKAKSLIISLGLTTKDFVGVSISNIWKCVWYVDANCSNFCLNSYFPGSLVNTISATSSKNKK